MAAMASVDDAWSQSCQKNAPGQRLVGNPFQLWFQTDPKKIRVGEFFKLHVSICSIDGSTLPKLLKVNAGMPTHGHGMNYRPTVENLAPGKFLAKGLMMHMAGKWLLRFEFGQGDKVTHLQTTVTLK